MAQAPAYYITTPIYYVNDKPHIGHAYTSLACDAVARFMRLDGYQVWFLTGTDEHGQKVEKAARKAGESTQAFVDRMSRPFRSLCGSMNFSNDDFIRTTEPRHIEAAQQLWRELEARDQIYLGSYAGWYAVRDETFYAQSEIVDGKAPTGAPVEWVEEPSYFFRLSQWRERLLSFYEDEADFVAPASRRNEVISFVKGGLSDLSISRTSFRWGVPVPGDDDHIMYVWLDALTNYLTGAGYPDVDGADFRAYWPADLHMVGKDILRFHAIFWPAFLMAAEIAPPKRVFAHGWWTNEGKKISKSLGNIIDPVTLIDTYGLDQVRYFLLREVPFGNDGDFSHRAMVNRMNGELANDMGNLVQRILAMIQKYCAARVPRAGNLDPADTALLDAAFGLIERVRGAFSRQAFHEALDAIWSVVRSANVYVDRQAPWKLRKSDPDRAATVLYVGAETVRHLALILQAVTPAAAARILDQLAVPEAGRGLEGIGPDGALVAGTPLPKPAGVFPRFKTDDDEARS